MMRKVIVCRDSVICSLQPPTSISFDNDYGVEVDEIVRGIRQLLFAMSKKGVVTNHFNATITIEPSDFDMRLDITVQGSDEL